MSSKKRKSCPWSSLPDTVALNCLARVSKSEQLAVSLVSKRFRSLIASPELCPARTQIGCTEPCLHLCLRIFPDTSPVWFVLSRNRQLKPIPSNPYHQPPESSSFVVVDWGIYVIGGLVNGEPTSDVSFLDCDSRTWRRVPSMNVARASASASLVDGKIYVFGGCGQEDADDDDSSKKWAEVYDPKTQTWCNFRTSKMVHSIQYSVVIEEEKKKKVYAVDEEGQSFYFSSEPRRLWRSGEAVDSDPGHREDWCSVGSLIYCIGTFGRIMWRKPGELDWNQVRGLVEMRWNLSAVRYFYNCFGPRPRPRPRQSPRENENAADDLLRVCHMRYELCKLCGNSADDGNIFVFWVVQLPSPDRLELWSAEISLERREGGEIWGNFVWVGALYKLDHPSPVSGIKVLCSAYVNL